MKARAAERTRDASRTAVLGRAPLSIEQNNSSSPSLILKVTPVLERKLKDATGTKMNWQALVSVSACVPTNLPTNLPTYLPTHSIRSPSPPHPPTHSTPTFSKSPPTVPHSLQLQAVFVGVPLPGTGAWTGAAIAALFKLSYAESVLGVVAGILSAGAIMTAVVLAGACRACLRIHVGFACLVVCA